MLTILVDLEVAHNLLAAADKSRSNSLIPNIHHKSLTHSNRAALSSNLYILKCLMKTLELLADKLPVMHWLSFKRE